MQLKREFHSNKTMLFSQIQKNWFEYFYFFVIVIYAAMATSFTKAMMYYSNPVGFALPVILTSILLVKNKVQFNNKELFIILSIIFIWFFLQYVKYSEYNITLSIFLLYNIIISYILIKIFNKKIFYLYEGILYYLSIVAIIGWLMMILIPDSFGALIDVLKFPEKSPILRGNIFIFSMTDTIIEDKTFNILNITRNSGFSWEPGRYASMVVFAIYFNLCRTNFNIKNNTIFWVLVIALLSTQSTTGYFGLIIILIYYILNKKRKSKIVSILILIPLIISAIYLPFLGEKISILSDSEIMQVKIDSDLMNKENSVYASEYAYVPQRFDGIALEFTNILNDPIIGYGNDLANSFVISNISDKLILSNGILKVFSRFGLFIGLLYYILAYRSSRLFAKLFNYKGSWLFFFIYISLSISYDFTTVPLFLSFILFEFISNNAYKYQFKKKSAHKLKSITK